METLGLTLAEGKLILKKVQESVVQEQVTNALLRLRCCPDCGKVRHGKGHHDVTVRTLFGNVELQSPRLDHCPCQPHAEKTFSPLQTFTARAYQSGIAVPGSEVEFPAALWGQL